MGDRKLTKSQRAQVMELLRCAADLTRVHLEYFSITDASDDRALRLEALAARRPVWFERGYGISLWDVTHEQYADVLLEAAARIEEGRWPHG